MLISLENQDNKMFMDNILVSSVVYVELIQGTRNKQELKAIDKTLEMLQGHKIELADALIGATALLNNIPIITCNIKHFMPIKNLIVIPFYPN